MSSKYKYKVLHQSWDNKNWRPELEARINQEADDDWEPHLMVDGGRAFTVVLRKEKSPGIP